ncbi:hypothetical protein [Thermohalobacter berrensis]|uniref:Uncharacterized protein n=1 Tax=Thermohalobacter berrensis TaxID=99594 RepID=A0A419T8P3_9FIRM|nr:hypothetical protein [Thermohalobacter berrensis]RKD33768.1 hypothetical protein BET03_08565 [Thermohalobacter berrensis]
MGKIKFKYPMMLFAKCECSKQVPIEEMEVEEKSDDKAKLRYKVKCSLCGKNIDKTLNLTEDEKEFTDLMNVFKVIPSIKDELAIIKLDTVKGRMKDKEIFLYGDYSHLRFWDNVVQKDLIKIPYERKE